ncbi:hypothetical protein BD779DRAFT_1608032 [Infundibulicybe gibba]|nr:hypothetical protein BD779DRAFT_1608032 [Infundibulicybe gibba]
MSSAADRRVRDEKNANYVKGFWLLLATIIAVLMFIRILRYILRPRQYSSEPQQARQCFALHRLLMAIVTGFNAVAFRWTITIGPKSTASVSELVFIIGYMVTAFIFLLIDTRDLQAMFWEDRAAHLASCQLPLIVALSGKNNIISFLTGVGHEKLNVLHRAAARTCLILLWIHAATRVTSGLPTSFGFDHGWMRSGALGLTAFSLATILSLRPIRQMVFEFFLVSHIILIFIFLISAFFHTRETGFGSYIWPALMIWASDRFLRIARMLFNNRFWDRSNPEHSIAIVKLLSDDTIRLTLRRRCMWKPGQHAYVTLPTISSIPTEAHPFTIATIPTAIPGTDDVEVGFLIRGRAGFTKRLREYAIRNPNSTVPALIDGPYGCPPDLRMFSTCILIAGGSGVSYTLPLLLNLIQDRLAGGNSAVRRIVFVWAVRDGGHLLWISEVLTQALASAPPSLVIEPRVHVTGSHYPIPQIPTLGHSPSIPSSLNSGASPKLEPELPLYSSLKLTHEISIASGPISVDVAGPSAITESVRRALRSNLASPLSVLRGSAPVTLHVETFGMVKG